MCFLTSLSLLQKWLLGEPAEISLPPTGKNFFSFSLFCFVSFFFVPVVVFLFIESGIFLTYQPGWKA